MNSVTRSIEIPASPAEVEKAWNHFLASVLIGRRRLACDELACVSAVDTGVIAFEATGDRRTRVTLNIPVPEGEPEQMRELIGQKASRDLVFFFNYIDGGDYVAERGGRFRAVDSGSFSLRRHLAAGEQLSRRRTARS